MSKQTKLTNPARRLLYFIRKAKGLKKTLTAKVALANIFELQHEDQAELFSKFSVFLKLIEDTERRITNLDHNDKDKFMKWVKKVLLDIIITVVIVATLFFKIQFLKIFLFIYTPLMLIGRLLALSGMDIQKKTGVKVPDWFFHGLYFINVTVLIVNQWWLLAGLWVIIWFLAFLYSKRSRKRNIKRMKRL